jgi:hypothetical protein
LLLDATASASCYSPCLTTVAGHAVAGWLRRFSGFTGVFAQSLDTTSTVLWGSNPKQIFSVPEINALELHVASAEGAIPGGSITFAWSAADVATGWQLASGQRLLPDGTLLWPVNGVRLSTKICNQVDLSLAESEGGPLFAWSDDRTETFRPFGQKVDDTGTVLWDPHGVALSTGTLRADHPHVVSDGADGGVIAWDDYRTGTTTPGVYATRMLGSGDVAPGWGPSGQMVCDTTGAQSRATACSDGGGGIIAAWVDERIATTGDIYAQTVSSSAILGWQYRWPVNGVQINSSAALQTQPISVQDGVGGMFVVWQDLRSGNVDIYVQRVTAVGTVAAGWPLSGLPVCTAPGHQYLGGVAYDNLDGVLISWADGRDSLATGYNIYAQRINRDAAASWTANGVAVCVAGGNQIDPVIAPAPLGGAILSWTDGRGADPDIYGQRLTAGGTPMWAPGGVGVAVSSGLQDHPTIVSDGAAGALVGWEDGRGPDLDIYMVRLDGTGAPASGWNANGNFISLAPGDQSLPLAVTNGASGAILVWTDQRDDAGDIYAAAVDSSGENVSGWTPYGTSISSAPGLQDHPTIVSDGAGGALIAWSDGRGADPDIYAYQVNSNGTSTWPVDGALVCDAPGSQDHPTIVSDGANPIIAWVDDRLVTKPGRRNGDTGALSGRNPFGATPYSSFGAGSNIFAQRVGPGGNVDETIWPHNGILVSAAPGTQSAPSVVLGFDHSFFVSWADARDGVSSVYATRILSQGQVTPVIGVVAPIPAPRILILSAPSPNPSRGKVAVKFSLPARAEVRAEVWGVDGRLVKTLVSGGDFPAGEGRLTWPGDTNAGTRAAAGIYYLRFSAGGQAETRRMVLVR